MPSHPQLNALRARYDVDAWLRVPRRREHLFVSGYRMQGNEIAYASLARSRAGPLRTGMRLRHTVWLPAAHIGGTPSAGNPILIDTYEQVSNLAARLELLNLVGEFHVPVQLQAMTDDLGEIALATADETYVAFVRGNIVQRVTQQRPTRALREVAREVDGKLTERPFDATVVADALDVEPIDGPAQAGDVRTAPLMQRAVLEAAAAAGRGPSFRIRGIGRLAAAARAANAADAARSAAVRPDEGEPFTKIFTRGGWIEQRNELVFNVDREADDEAPSLEVFVTGQEGIRTCARCELRDGTWREGGGGER